MWLDKTSQIWLVPGHRRKILLGVSNVVGNLSGSWPKKKDKKPAINKVIGSLTEFWPKMKDNMS
jgi:hypothetical protein